MLPSFSSTFLAEYFQPPDMFLHYLKIMISLLWASIFHAFARLYDFFVLLAISSKLHHLARIGRKELVDVNSPSLYSQVPAPSIHFYKYFSLPCDVYECLYPWISRQGILSISGVVFSWNLPRENYARLLFVASGFKQLVCGRNELTSLPLPGTYILLFNPFSFSNIFHWLAESLLRAWLSKSFISTSHKLLLPDSKISSFAIDSLRAIGLKNDYIIHNPSFSYERVRIICSGAMQFKYNPLIATMGKSVVRSILGSHDSLSQHSILYVKRHPASIRKIINEEELIASISSVFNVTCIEPSSMSFGEQVQAFSNAYCVISIHGAALTNILWMSEHTHVVELYKDLAGYLGDKYAPNKCSSPCYSRLAYLLNQHYHLFQCDVANIDSSVATASLNVDCEKLLSLLTCIML